MQNSASLRSVNTAADPSTFAANVTEPVSRNVLLLQGPIGPFFSRFATDLTDRGFNVTKINFNGGDSFFHRSTVSIDYTGTLQGWEAWIERVVVNRGIGRIYLFGDCRAYHRLARKVAKRLNVRVFVFEEGYLRPNFITLEEDGVNGHSTMLSRQFTGEAVSSDIPAELQHPGHIFQLTAIYSMVYYIASAAGRSRFPGYRHHRSFNCLAEGGRWIRSGIRKLKYSRLEKHVLPDLLAQFDGNYFLCPLQVHCDMQVVEHSKYNSIEQFIGDVLVSFKDHASSNKAIVFKHHPMDRGYTDYSTLLANKAAEFGLHGRVFYVHDPCLPTLLKHAQGTVLINSTVGISSLFHGTPVKTLGKAVYDIKGLTAQEPLSDFWSCEKRVDSGFFRNFRAYLIATNQLNANLYRRIGADSATGIVWSEYLSDQHTWQGTFAETFTTGQLPIGQGSSRNDADYGDKDASEAA